MLNASLILFCILLYTLQTLLFKMYADRYPGNEKYTTFVYVSVCGLVASVISFAVGGFSYEFNLTTFILGSINAAMYFLYYLFIYHASKNGPYSVVMIFSIIGGISLPVISDIITLDKIPSIGKVICLLVIFAAAYLVNKRDGETGGFKNKKVFFLSCIGVLLANGAYGSLLNIQQTYTDASQNDEMLIYSAFFAAHKNLNTVKTGFAEKVIFIFHLVIARLVMEEVVEEHIVANRCRYLSVGRGHTLVVDLCPHICCDQKTTFGAFISH